MSSDPFDLLGLDRAAATDADVRRAYAERLKATRPEDDRAGFMALRAAFERARSEVRWRNEEDYDDADEDDGAAEAEAAPLETALDDSEVPYEDFGDPLPPEEAAFDARIRSAMDDLVDVLTGSPFGPSPARIREVIDRDEVSGLEEYQTMQWQVRQLLCDRTGFNLDPQEIRRPDWLTLAVFDLLDGYYGWTRQPTTNGYERRLNDWLARVRKELAWLAIPKEARKQAELNRLLGKGAPEGARPVRPSKGQSRWEHEPGGGGKGSFVWLWIGAGILISQVVRVLAGMDGG